MLKLTIFLSIILTFTFSLSAQSTDETLAIQYYSNGEYDKAASLFERLYDAKPNTYLYNYLVNSYIGAENFAEAEKFINKLLRRDKNNQRYKIDLGYVFIKSGRTDKGTKEYDEALRNLTASRQAVVELANVFLFRNEYDYALKTFQKGRTLIKDYTFGLELGSIYERLMKYEEMIKEYLDLLEFNTAAYLTTVQNILQNSLTNDPEGRKNTALKNELLKRIQLNPTQTFYSEMLLWYSIQQKDFETAFNQAKAIDKRLKQNGNEVYRLGELALSNEAYVVAAQCFQYIIEKGDYNPYYIDSRINLLHAEYRLATRDASPAAATLQSLEKKYITLIDDYGQNYQTLPLIKDLAYLQAFMMNKTAEASLRLNSMLKTPGIPPQALAECKILLADILLMTGDVWEATLLYSQVEKAFKNAPVAHEAKFRNARLSFYIGEFDWAKAQLDVLKASTSKLIANDALELSLLIADNIDYDSSYVPLSLYARADLLSFRNLDKQALELLDSIENEFKGHLIVDDIIYKKAAIHYKLGNYTTTDSLYAVITNKYNYSILADDALLKRALIQENIFKNNEKAMELYQEIILNYPGSLYTVEARKRYRTLRGDFVN